MKLNRNMPEKGKKSVMKELAPFFNMGYQLAVTLIVGVLLGWWIDKTYNTSPRWTVVFSLVFAAVAMYNFIRTSLEAGKKKKPGDK